MSTYEQFEIEVEGDKQSFYKTNLEGNQSNHASEKKEKGWKRYKHKLLLSAGIFIVASASFQSGYLLGKRNKTSPVTVNQPSCAQQTEAKNTENASPEEFSERKTKTSNSQLASSEKNNCTFVASKNSNKFHLSTCQFAQKIKSENKVCFATADEAIKRGYQGAKCCIK